MKLERIRVDFDVEQDRLLMRVLIGGGSEVCLWLTRRCVRRFWSAMLKMAEHQPEVQRQPNPEVRTALLQMAHEKALQEVKFSKNEPEPTGSPPRAQPLGPEPLLVTRIQARREGDGRTLLALLPSQGQGAHLTLTENLLHGLMKLMQQAVERAEWDMTLELPKAPMMTDEVPETRILN